MNYKLLSAVIFFFLLYPSLFSHHAMEYIEMESYSTARKREFIFHLHFDYMVDDLEDSSLDHWEFTPGFSYGITDRLMADVHAHYAKFGAGHLDSGTAEASGSAGPSPFMEAAAFSLQYRLTQNLPVNIAAAATIEIPFGRSRQLIGGQMLVEVMLIGSLEFGNHANVTVNLAGGSDGPEGYTAWALGVKSSLTGDLHGIAGGVEVMGDFAGGVSVLAGVYFPLGSENLIFKTGLEFSSRSSRANTTLMARF